MGKGVLGGGNDKGITGEGEACSEAGVQCGWNTARGRDAGHGALGQQREDRTEPDQHGPVGVYFLEPHFHVGRCQANHSLGPQFLHLGNRIS